MSEEIHNYHQAVILDPFHAIYDVHLVEKLLDIYFYRVTGLMHWGNKIKSDYWGGPKSATLRFHWMFVDIYNEDYYWVWYLLTECMTTHRNHNSPYTTRHPQRSLQNRWGNWMCYISNIWPIHENRIRRLNVGINSIQNKYDNVHCQVFIRLSNYIGHLHIYVCSSPSFTVITEYGSNPIYY